MVGRHFGYQKKKSLKETTGLGKKHRGQTETRVFFLI
jgi:hypothetical protein